MNGSPITSVYDINKFNMHQHMYQSFVRGNLNNKRLAHKHMQSSQKQKTLAEHAENEMKRFVHNFN